MTAVWNLSDESLLVGLGSGDADAAAAFVRRFQRRVFGLTHLILRDRGAAEEAAQEAFVRAWRHAATYDPARGSVAAWLLKIARNAALNMLPARRPDPVDPGTLSSLVEPGGAPSDGVEAVAETESMKDALRSLPHEQRRAVVLAAFYGLTAREIGELDGVPLGTVKTRIRSALTKLRSELMIDDR
jgi:RNA polymerase sigma-70 factor (ECF subfamily)